MQNDTDSGERQLTKRGERRVFLFITVFLFPVLSVIVVGAAATLSSLAGFGDGFDGYRVGTIACLLAAFPGFLASFRVRGSASEV